MSGATECLASAAAAGFALALAACTGSLFTSKAAPPTIYVLSAGNDAAAVARSAAPMPVDLAVLKTRVRLGLESNRIAILFTDRHLDYFADARWTGAVGDVVQDLAIQAFRARANLRSVSGDSSVFASAYWVEIEVVDFQAEYSSARIAPLVRVDLRARLGNSSDRRLLGRFEAKSVQTATENRLTAIVDAYATAVDAALAQIVADATDTLRKSSEAR